MGGRVVYLSDLKPASYRHIPYLQLAWPYQADRSVLGGRLRAGGRLYLKGLGMHSPSRITYDLDEPYRRFEAEVAIDAEAGARGSVVFRVFVDDGGGTWQEQATSEIVRGGEPPVPISVDLTGAKRISLLVDFADRGDELDHADWLERAAGALGPPSRPELPQPVGVGQRQRHQVLGRELAQAAVQRLRSRRTPCSASGRQVVGHQQRRHRMPTVAREQAGRAVVAGDDQHRRLRAP